MLKSVQNVLEKGNWKSLLGVPIDNSIVSIGTDYKMCPGSFFQFKTHQIQKFWDKPDPTCVC